MATMGKQSLPYIIDHVFLPPKLPQMAEDDEIVGGAEQDLIKMVLNQLQAYRHQNTQSSTEINKAWLIIEKMLGHCTLLGGTSSLPADQLIASFDDTLLIHLKAQNAALILRTTDEEVIFECFEATAQASAVMEAKGSIIRRFPAHAIAIPVTTFNDPNFRRELSVRLSQLDAEVIDEMVPRSQKEGSKTGEVRDTACPGLVTEMLMAILAPLGRPVTIRCVRKRIRDDVLWNNCVTPWRRSPFWLCLRVALQTTLTTALPADQASLQYKNFLIFVLTEITSRASTSKISKIPGDVCHIMVAKIARRVSKLGQENLAFVQDRALRVCRAIRTQQDDRWKAVQDEDADRQTTLGKKLEKSQFERDTALSLNASKFYLSGVLDHDNRIHRSPSAFVPQCQVFLKWSPSGLPYLDDLKCTKEENVYGLTQLEAWVMESLPTWKEKRLLSLPSRATIAKDCMALARLGTGYCDKAINIYDIAPEQKSMMIVVIAEIWHVLDILVMRLQPLLSEYSPALPINLFEPLLLPKRLQMQRLQEIELHIAARRSQAKITYPSIFSDPEENSFVVKYYASSDSHLKLKRRIEEAASVAKGEKQHEWNVLTEKSQQMKDEAKLKVHDNIAPEDDPEDHDSETCGKCALERDAESLMIDVHEWPLPEDAISCASVLVELDCPLEFAAWRNVTWMLLQDFGRSGGSAGAYPVASLTNHSGLESYAQDRHSRLTLASLVKPYRNAQYPRIKLPLAVDDCYMKNMLQYKLFDPIKNAWISDQPDTLDLQTFCVTTLPQGPYADLQFAVDSTLHSQNQVIAEQEHCSTSLSLHEFLSFGSLRADGERTQWFNIKRELAASNLNFSTEAVCTLVTQAAWQAGSGAETVHRNSHRDHATSSFCEELLAKTHETFTSIQANWKSDNAMLLITIIVLRTMSLSADLKIVGTALVFLRKIRSAVQQWTENLVSTLRAAVDSEQISRTQQRLLKNCALCKMTYDVDAEYYAKVMNTTDDLKAWVSCSIRIRENFPGDEAVLPKDIRCLLLRDMKVSYSLYPHVRSLIVDDENTGLELAIAQIWSSLQPGSACWDLLKAPSDRWLSSEIELSPDHPPQKLHYNILDGEFLIDGKPLGRLPTEYIRNDLYQKVFGAQILNVSPADMAGMLYMSAHKTNGYFVYFGMRGEHLIIRTRKGSETLELVPHNQLLSDLPMALVNNYMHWLNIQTQEIEFRPLKEQWQSDPDNWCLHYQRKRRAVSTIRRCKSKLVDLRSATFKAVMEVFGPLENPEHVHATYSEDHGLEVALVRFDLHFVLNSSGEFACRELCRIVDSNQYIGTLIGLEHRLVLCGTLPKARMYDRIVIVPEGKVSVVQQGSHVHATIDVDGPIVRFFRFQIDETLRRLQGDNEILGTLYKAYLHALTSHFLPDPLTERTGTEEAMSCLQQRSLSFIRPPESRAVDLLISISALTPRRNYYPRRMRVMQQVHWHQELSPLAQHDDYLPLAERIISSGDRYVAFYPDSEETRSLYGGHDKNLLSRAQCRNSWFRNCESGGDVDVRSQDSDYVARDRLAGTQRGSKSFEMSSLVRDWPRRFEVSKSLSKALSKYGTLHGFGTKFDAHRPLSELLEVSFASSWGPLHGLCQSSIRARDTYHLLFLFSILAYGRGIKSLKMLRTLLAFAFSPELRELSLPLDYSFFAPENGYKFNEEALRLTLLSNIRPYKGVAKTKFRAQWQVESEKYAAESEEQVEAVVREYKCQWPCEQPTTPDKSLSTHLRWRIAPTAVSDLFYIWTANKEFSRFLRQVQPLLDDIDKVIITSEYTSLNWRLIEDLPVLDHFHRLPSQLSLMSETVPTCPSRPEVLKRERRSKITAKNDKLRTLISAIRLETNASKDQSIRNQYRNDLLASFDAFSNYKEEITPKKLPCTLEDAIFDRSVCEGHVGEVLRYIRDLLGPKTPIAKLLELSGLWPRLSTRTLLSLLSSKLSTYPNPSWKTCLLALGEALTVLQRARRLILAAERDDVSDFCVEVENEGHRGWDLNEWPDWLLIELESDFLIRPTQARVALEMIQPGSSANSLVQMNMGEGKSSVIVPLVASAIANGHRLSRVIVLKSLTKQMSDTMTLRLGGLVGRQIYFLPFSRKLQLDEDVVSQIQDLHEECLNNQGILLAQPEHILSYKLMGIERLTSGDFHLASQLLSSQRWLETNTRDILDESDELLDVKFQLIYTLGTQRMMDGQPDRWLIVQDTLDLVEKNAATLLGEFPRLIEVERRTASSFPTIRLLSANIGKQLTSKIARDVVDSHLPGLNFEFHLDQVKDAALRFIQERSVTGEDCDLLKEAFGDQESFVQKLLQVRGLIAYDILLFVLRSKRWSVNYGLHPSRCLSAVPYRAKGVPAPSAEFGHPDVSVALTCMSYYYTGLSDAQIRRTLEMLQRSDDPSVEYASWIKKCEFLPSHLQSWTAVNLEDDRQCYDELFPALRYNKKVADFFMTSVVFPKEGKEFDEKLSTSAWDIVAKKGPHLTTGFSGTNDNRFVLPLPISQQDLPELQHNSGKVLDYLLRKINLDYHCACDTLGRQLSAEGLIQCFVNLDPSIRVLIDVGAQVLDTLNENFVRSWIDVATDVDAGVFFDEDDNVMVLTRYGKLEKLAVSSFQNRMDRCVVYLDEVHTRGTDLKLPAAVRAAVTLGPKLTKDRLVQACMRLRKLAQGQSLLYLAPPEVHQNIIELTGKGEMDLDGYDVVAWTLEQSCECIERSQTSRIMQGLNYSQRQLAMNKFSATYSDPNHLETEIYISSDLVKAFREKEEQRLIDLYAPIQLKTNILPSVIESSQESSDTTVQLLLEMWKGLDPTASEGSSVHQEHEREVSHEVEEETEVERPPKVTPRARVVDPKLQEFVLKGRLDDLVHFSPAHTRVMKSTSAKDPHAGNRWIHLRVTNDFANTVEPPLSGYYDDYLRPVNWILTSKEEPKAGSLLVISQFEVNELLREIQKPTSGVYLHVYEPRVMKSMSSVDSGSQSLFVGDGPVSISLENWQSLDSGLKRELNLFAGQLYFNTFKDYKKLLKELKRTQSMDQTLSFVKAWIAIRRKGQDFLQTHVGQLVSGRVIKEEAFE